MLREAPTASTPALAGRAELARLTLELRAAVRDAEAAELAAAAAGLDMAREKLRARLQPLVEDRRTAFEAELIEVRAEAAASIAAARRAAAAMVTQEYSLADRVAVLEESAASIESQRLTIGVPALVHPQYVPLFASLAVAPPPESLPPVDEMLRWFDDRPTADTDAPQVDAPPAVAPPASHAQLAPTNVGIDAEAFAQAFAAAFAALLDERGGSWGVGVPGVSVVAGPAGRSGRKPSFWTHARHPDVLLIGLAMIIMMIVVAAWLA